MTTATLELRAPSRRRARVLDWWIFGDDVRRGVAGVAATGLLITWYVVAFTRVDSHIYRGYGYGTFDLSFSDQGVWLLSRFHAPFLTIAGRNLFGDHAQFSLLALVPLYWLGAGPTTLFFVQALAMALGAVPVYLLAMRRLRSPLFATVLAASFLLHPALGRSNLENFHPDAFLVPLIGFALYAAIENRPRMFVVFCVLALACKEDVVLVILPLALWYAWRHNKKIGGLVAALSVLCALAVTNFVMRPLVGVSTRNAWRLPFSTCKASCSVTRHVGDLAIAVFTKPASVVKYLLRGGRPNGRPFYAWQMIAPTGLMFLIAPEVAAIGLLVLTSNVLSLEGTQHQISYHYSMVLLPILAMATVYAVSRLTTHRRRAIAVAIVGGASLVSAYMWGPYAFSRHGTGVHLQDPSVVAAIDHVRAQLPPNAVVSAYDRFLPHVDHRVGVYLWPTPFAASHWGLFHEEGRRLPQADTVQYLLLPPQLSAADGAGVLQQIRSDFVVIARAENDRHEGAVLYRRVSS